MCAFLLELEPNWNKIGKVMCFCTWVQNTSACHPPLQEFSTGGYFAPKKYFAMSRDILGCYNLRGECVPGIQWVEPRDIAKHPHTMHKMLSKTKSYLDQNFNSSKDEKNHCTVWEIYFKAMRISIPLLYWIDLSQSYAHMHAHNIPYLIQ